MDAVSFDRLTLQLSRLVSRRATIGGLGALIVPGLVDAKKRKRKKRKNKKVAFNDFGCVNVGDFCRNSGQCCSGICQGKKGKKTCKVHDATTCQTGQSPVECGGAADVDCTTSSGGAGTCFTTTGNAGYCSGFQFCFACTKDADCQEQCGPQAACAPCSLCASLGLQTSCLGPNGASCSYV